MSAYHRHYSSRADAEANGEVEGADEGCWHGQTSRFTPCKDCNGLWVVAVNEYGHPWTGWPDCPGAVNSGEGDPGGGDESEGASPNENCLAGMSCPECGSPGPFLIRAVADFVVSDDGTELAESPSVAWDDDSPCTCPACGHQDRVLSFDEEGRGPGDKP